MKHNYGSVFYDGIYSNEITTEMVLDMFREWKRGDYQKKLWNGAHQEEENEVDLKLPGRKGLEDWWEKRD